MDKKLKNLEILGAILTSVLGILFHFAYAFFGESPIAAPFFAINESVWEHTKLLFVPALIFSIIEYFIVGKQYKNYFFAKLIGLIAGILIIPVIFYAYSGALGYNLLIIDILLFFFASYLSFKVSYEIIKSGKFTGKALNIISLFLIILLAVMYITFTYYPPDIPLFTPEA